MQTVLTVLKDIAPGDWRADPITKVSRNFCPPKCIYTVVPKTAM